MTDADTRPRFLMCRPEHFAVAYAINPWMRPQRWQRQARALTAAAWREWTALRKTLEDLGAAIELVPPAAGLPDLVFTANAAVVLDRKALLSRFRHPERQVEEPHVAAAFRALQARGMIDCICTLPPSTVLEGAGDCIFDQARGLFWMGYGPRSDAAAAAAVRDTFGVEAVALELVDPRFYHIDTALCPLPGGEVMCVPHAFTAAARAAIAARVPADRRIEIGARDAARLAANAVCVGTALVMPACSDPLRARLEACGYRVMVTPLTAFRQSGGAAFCLTLRLDLRSSAAAVADGVAV